MTADVATGRGLTALATPAGYLAAALAAAALPLFLGVVGSGTISAAATSVWWYVPALAMLASTVALLVALIAMYVPRAAALGRFGLLGFLAALVGTVLAAGGAWSYVFVLPYLAADAPSLADESSGSVLVGFVASYAVMSLGWLLFAVACRRSRGLPRWATTLLAIGALVTVVPMPSRTLLLAIAVACIAHVARREVTGARQ